jgi:DNA-binding MarR family transcriptional regulator
MRRDATATATGTAATPAHGAAPPSSSRLDPGAEPPDAAAPLDQSRLSALTGYRLKRAYLAAQQRSSPQFARFGMTAAEFAVMLLIDANPDASQRRLCDALAVSPPNMVGLLDRLEARGWIARSRDESDRRAWRLRATPAGARIARQAERHMLAFEREQMLAGLTPAQARSLRRLLERI